jgi:AcrR family transcriptional regulator
VSETIKKPAAAKSGDGAKSGPGRKDGHRRGEILAVARKLFAARGFEATSIREIGEGAGILSGSLYYHFDTKEEMLHEIIKDHVFSLLKGYEKCAAASPDPRTALEELIRFGITRLIDQREVHAIVVNERGFILRQPSFAYLEETWQEVFRTWYGVLREGVRAGVFREDLNLHLVLRIIMDSINATIVWFRPGGRYAVEEVVETQTGILMSGLTVQKS